MSLDTFVEAGSPDDVARGQQLIAAGKVGCIVLAGGDGSRLGWSGPKGTYPLSLVRQKTLFDMLQEKALAASLCYGRPLHLAIMTSPLNVAATQDAFVHYPGKVDFFVQQMSPLLDHEQKPLSELRPNGNGEVLKLFDASGLAAKWKAAGVEYLHLIFIDNPLADPFDPNLIGVQARQGADVALKAILREHPEEKVGVIGEHEGKLRVVEYTENPPAEWRLANTGLFAFHLSFVEKAKRAQLPLHLAKKFFGNKTFYKQEYFLFDLLPLAERPQVVLYPREETFAPLKSKDDIGAVQRALLNRDKKQYAKVSGVEPTDRIFELDASFHYPTQELLNQWRGKPLPPTSYIAPS